MVGGEIVVGEGVKEIEVSDDGVAAVVALKEGAEEVLGGNGIGIIETHRDFAADDLFFFFEFVEREGGAEDHLDEGGEEEVERLSRAIDVVNGAVEGSVGIPLATGGLDFLGEGGAGEVVGAFEDHVFEEV